MATTEDENSTIPSRERRKSPRRRRFCSWVICMLLALSAGGVTSALCARCTTPGPRGDRLRDAGDIFTATIGSGFGVTARVGLIHLGLFSGTDRFGVRGGHPLPAYEDPTTTDPFIIGFPWIEWRDGWCFYYDRFGLFCDVPQARGKAYEVDSRIPLVAYTSKSQRTPPPWSFYTQIEGAVGLGAMVRLGFNFGECYDFLCGWSGRDPCHDDIGTVPRQRTQLEMHEDDDQERLRRNPKDTYALRRSAHRYYSQGQKKKAAEYFERLVAVKRADIMEDRFLRRKLDYSFAVMRPV